MTANQLGQSTSPYLLQHKDNPVRWRLWSRETLAEAKAKDKPILLSVGYAACHWCHVMAHESFEDPAIASVMNDLFIPVKVDREERPDLDQIYMTALQALGQRGGWPMTMFLTPDGDPFWGGTYFPNTPRHGMPGFRQVMEHVAGIYRDQPDTVRNNTQALTQVLTEAAEAPGQGPIAAGMLDDAASALVKVIDMDTGGLSGAPKFPQVPILNLMWRGALRSGAAPIRQAVWRSAERMCQGGLFDHLGGGFARYSTDERWLVPHFEKMLYDNAQLIELLTELWKDGREPLFAARVAETVAWLEREMIAENGAFAATLDADSEGVEGKFYVWTAAEIDAVLSGAEGRLFKQAYDVTPQGNWDGATVLNRLGPQPEGADIERVLGEARRKLFATRDKRVPPDRDDKVLADWNGLMIAALTKAGAAFDQGDWITLAVTAFDTVAGRMGRPGDRLAHSMRHGRLMDTAMLEDYAAMARAALALHEVLGEDRFLDRARAWTAVADAHYWDGAAGGYFMTADDAADVVVRPKSAMDGATPSGNGMMLEVLARLHLLTGSAAYGDRAQALLDAFSADVPRKFPNMATLLYGYELLARPIQVTVVGNTLTEEAIDIRAQVFRSPCPTLVYSEHDDPAALPPGHPAAGKGPAEHGAVGISLCRDRTCLPVFTDSRSFLDAFKEACGGR